MFSKISFLYTRLLILSCFAVRKVAGVTVVVALYRQIIETKGASIVFIEPTEFILIPLYHSDIQVEQ